MVRRYELPKKGTGKISVSPSAKASDPARINGQTFLEITFHGKYRGDVLYKYLPYVESKAYQMRSENRVLMVYTNSSNFRWEKTTLIHPSTFETMAMSINLKRSVLDDINLFIRRKEFYKKVGKAWKRGYLLYGPPGTGKSSLVAAIANYLSFDIYDLQLTGVQDDSSLKKLLLGTKNASILLLEDIDRSLPIQTNPKGGELSLAGLLNCNDGIWSSCGEERIIIFTTNHKETLDLALLRPGRMDVHIHMGYCCFEAFVTLASNYLGLDEDALQRLFPEVKRLISKDVITPAEVAEELMKSEIVEVAMGNLVKVLESRSSVSEDDRGR
ncbi:unnamed protein product [Arabis nemorensis]|uniref:AAA+ ATPase domain-containing protein n=1 Tax=Arabis nemorensis TaxID=586526 RepID=A0A565CMM7_9BRAS|nr:unnamed protein product [Arabis nemorensis]